MSEESKTPRTDASQFKLGGGPALYVYAAKCAEIETALAEKTRELEEERTAHARTKQRRQQIDDEAYSYSEQLTAVSLERDRYKAIAERLAVELTYLGMMFPLPTSAENALRDFEALGKGEE